MKKLCVFLMAALCFSTALRADEIHFKNGSILIGEIQKVKKGRLYLKSTLLPKTTHFDWSEVKSFSITDPVRLVSSEGFVQQGWLEKKGGHFYIIDHQGKQTVSLQQIHELHPLNKDEKANLGEKPVFGAWTHQVQLGGEYFDGNADQVVISSQYQAQYIHKHYEFTGLLRGAYGFSNGARNVQNIYSSLDFNWLHTPRFFTTYLVSGEHDYIQNLSLRGVQQVGAGYKLIKTKRTLFSAEAGIGYTEEIYRNLSNLNFVSAFARLSFEQKISTAILWINHVEFLPNLQNLDDYRITATTQLKAAVYKGLSFSIGLEDRFDNLPAAGVKKNDIHLKSSLIYDF